MKKLILMLMLLVAASAGWAQAPGIFNYQGVARNSVGNVLVNKSISLRLTIHDGSATGATVYSETRGVTTNPFGLFNVQVGSSGATAVTGTITGVNWTLGTKFIQVEIDPNGGASFINVGTAQLVSVPYSMSSLVTGDLVLPFTKSQAAGTPLIGLTNTGTSGAGSFTINNAANSASALFGSTNGTGAGILGSHSATTGTSAGVRGETNSVDANATGVTGVVTSTAPGGFSSGVRGINSGTSGLGIGVYGSQNASGWGVYGTAPDGIGVYGNGSNAGFGVYGNSNTGVGVNGTSNTGIPGQFTNTNATNVNPALYASTTSDGVAIDGSTSSTSSSVAAIRGTVTSTTPGGFSSAVRGINNSTGGLGIGVWGSQNGSGWGLYGVTPNGIGVYGNSSSAGFGLYGNSNSGTGVFAISTSGVPAEVAIQNNANNNSALKVSSVGNGNVVNVSTTGTGIGVRSTTDAGTSFDGTTNAVSSAAFVGRNNAGGEVVVGLGNSDIGSAVVGRQDGNAAGVRGFNTNAGYGVLGQAGLNGGTGVAGRFENQNNGSTSNVLEVDNVGIGSGIKVQMSNASNGGRGVDVNQTGVGPGVFATSAGGSGVWGITSSISAAGVIGDNTFGEAVVGRNRGGNGVGAVVGRNDSTGYGVRGFNTKDGIGVLGQAGISGGTGVGGRFENVNAANTNTALQVATNGIGSGISVQMSNASNGARGIDVSQSGVGPGVFATSAGGNAVWGITSSISAAGVIGDNTFGEAVVGRNRGGNGVGAVVGRNDSTGYGVRGFNTKDGIGVLGQAGISGGTGIGGRFENVNAANGTPVLQAAGNGTGATLQVSNSNAGAVDLATFKKNSGNVARIDDTGKGFFNGGTQTGGADLAEAFDVEGDTKEYEPGDVLEISTNSDRTITKSSGAYSTLVVGVYATKPGVLLTEEGVDSKLEGKVPMGVVGVIPTKVCLEGGAIKRGDLLVTSSIPGVAMKADPSKVQVGQVLGKALQDYDATTVGKIKVLVSIK